MSEKNRVKMKIAGNELVVSADEDIEYITLIGKRIDSEINAIIRGANGFSVPMAAIMCAVNYCDNYEKEQRLNERLEKDNRKMKEVLKQAAEAHEAMAKENSELKEEKNGLHKRIDELKAEISKLTDKNKKPVAPAKPAPVKQSEPAKQATVNAPAKSSPIQQKSQPQQSTASTNIKQEKPVTKPSEDDLSLFNNTKR